MKAIRLLMPRRRPDPAVIAQLARLLAAGWAQPGLRLATGLVETGWQHELGEALANLEQGRASLSEVVSADLEVLDRATSGQSADELLVELAAEYAALFQGPGRALVPAYECQWLDDPDASLFVAPSTMAVEAVYRAAGMEMSNREPPDSLAVELEFVGRLATLEAGTHGPRAVGWRAQRVQFVAEHPARWIEPFCTAVEQATEHGYYAALARLTQQVNAVEVLGA